MSFARAATPFASALRYSSTHFSARPAASQLCSGCLQTLYRRLPAPPPQRRRLATATAYHPETLDTHPPPRNTGIPETSIASATPRDTSRPTTTTSSQFPNASITEGEAQKPRPAPSATSTSSAAVATPEPSPAKPQRRSKLRARKAAMNLTPGAVTQLRELLNQPEPKLIRVGVKNRGCSGLAYHLEYVEKQGAFDEAVEQEGVKVLIDSKALFSIIGSEMDWVEDKLNRRFVFKNPNITEQCGCGESFSIS